MLNGIFSRSRMEKIQMLTRDSQDRWMQIESLCGFPIFYGSGKFYLISDRMYIETTMMHSASTHHFGSNNSGSVFMNFKILFQFLEFPALLNEIFQVVLQFRPNRHLTALHPVWTTSQLLLQALQHSQFLTFPETPYQKAAQILFVWSQYCMEKTDRCK